MAKKKGDVSAAIEAQKLEKGQKSDVKNMGEELQKEQKKKNAPLKQRSGKASFEVKAREDKVLSFGQKSGDDDSGTAGIVVKEWQRLPKQLLHEYCQRQKLPKVHLKLEGVDKRCRVIIPDPKGKSVNTRMFVIHNEENMSGRMLTEIGAMRALWMLDRTQPIERRMPKEFGDRWLQISSEKTPDRPEEVRKRKEEKKASISVAMEQRRRRELRDNVSLWVNESKKGKLQELLTQDEDDANEHPREARENKAGPTDVKDRFRNQVVATLSSAGFEQKDAEQGQMHALKVLQQERGPEGVFSAKEAVERAIEYLCAVVPRQRLPAAYKEDERVSIALRASSIEPQTTNKLPESLAFLGLISRETSGKRKGRWCLSSPEPIQEEMKEAQRQGKVFLQAIDRLEETLEFDLLLLEEELRSLSLSESFSVQGIVPEEVEDELEALQAILGSEYVEVDHHGTYQVVRIFVEIEVEKMLWKAASLSQDTSKKDNPTFLFPITMFLPLSRDTSAVEGSYPQKPLLLALPRCLFSDEMKVKVLKEAYDEAYRYASEGEPALFAVFDRVKTIVNDCISEEEKKWSSGATPAQKPVEKVVSRSKSADQDRAKVEAPRSHSNIKKREAQPKKTIEDPLLRPLGEDEAKRLSVDLFKSHKQKEEAGKTSIQKSREELPAYKHRRDITRIIASERVSIVCGGTGCGKSTQVPQLLLEEFIKRKHGGYAKIVVTQPRRIAALALAQRVSEERGEGVGDVVGYAVRNDRKVSRRTRLVFMTVGLLLRMLEGTLDQSFAAMSHLVIDEVHERSLDSDLLLAIVKQIIKRVPDVKIVLMSATVNVNLFASFFGGSVGRISIEGRVFPVQEHFLDDYAAAISPSPSSAGSTLSLRGRKHPRAASTASDYAEESLTERQEETMRRVRNHDVPIDLILCLLERIAQQRKKAWESSQAAVEEWEKKSDQYQDIVTGGFPEAPPDGTVVVFLPGIAEIRRLLQLCRASVVLSRCEVLPLHSSFSAKEQSRVFAPLLDEDDNISPSPGGRRKKRRIVLTTNIAETSVTVPLCTVVIDCGRERMAGFESESATSSLTETWISSASHTQRRGRAGRVRPGVCFNTFSKKRHAAFEKETLPEIQRVCLDGPLLRVISFLNSLAYQKQKDAPAKQGEKTVSKKADAKGKRQMQSSKAERDAAAEAAPPQDQDIVDVSKILAFFGSTPQPPSQEELWKSLESLKCSHTVEEIADEDSGNRAAHKRDQSNAGGFVAVEEGEGRVEALRKAMLSTKRRVRLTALGRHICSLGGDIAVGRLLVFGASLGVPSSALSLAALLSTSKPLFRSPSDSEERETANATKKSLSPSTPNDFVALLRAFNEYLSVEGRKRDEDAVAERLFLNKSAAAEASDLRRLFARQLKTAGFELDPSVEKTRVSLAYLNADPLPLVEAVITGGLYPRVAFVKRPLQKYQKSIAGVREIDSEAKENRLYLQNRERVFIHPSSLLFHLREYPFPYVVFAEKSVVDKQADPSQRAMANRPKTYLRQCMIASVPSLLLFGGAVKADMNRKRVTVDGWLEFEADAQLAALLRGVRRRFDSLLSNLLVDPSSSSHLSPSAQELQVFREFLSWKIAATG